MSLAEKQQQLAARYLVIEDPHERLTAMVMRAKKWPAPDTAARIDAHRVPGCVSRVWLIGRLENGGCHWLMDAESPLVKGLVAIHCELAEGESPAEVASFEPNLISALHLDRQISPTRLQGLASVMQMIRSFAQSQLTT